MARPLYHGSDSARWNQGNAGLWYDKFCDRWNNNFGETDKQEWIRHMALQPVGDPKLLGHHVDRLCDLVASREGTLLAMKTDGPFVAGLGRAHPVENGFAWHHLLGVPYLPGSSLNGLVRALARDWLAVDENDIDRIFGGQQRVGTVIFFDALPARPVKLKSEILTPHCGQWNLSPQVAPGDWHNPVPIPFLAVDKDQGFVFAVAPRRNDEQAKRDCQAVEQWLRQALELVGAGAKTSIGFGRFVSDPSTQSKLEERVREKDADKAIEQATQGLSPLAAELARQAIGENWESDKDAFSRDGNIEAWLDRLEQERDREAIDRFGQLLRLHFREVLENPDKTNKKGKPVHKKRQSAFAKRFLALEEND